MIEYKLIGATGFTFGWRSVDATREELFAKGIHLVECGVIKDFFLREPKEKK